MEGVNENFANHDEKSARYRTVRMISRAGAHRIPVRELRLGGVHSLQCSVRVS